MSQAQYTAEISLTTITISGPDAAAFMQSQLTLDIDNIEDGLLYPAAWCRPDGRVDAVLLVALEDQQVMLVLPSTLAETVHKRARMYSIGRRVKIGQESQAICPAQSTHAGKRVLALSFDSDRALAIAAVEQPGTSNNVAWRLPVDWLRADIACGMPWIVPQTSGMFLPQMIGLEALGGLSYKKGCFPGQEVIARVHYRGRVTRRITRFRLSADRPPAPGATFEIGGKPACVLYGAASPNADEKTDGLAVVTTDADTEAEICIAGVAGILVSA